VEIVSAVHVGEPPIKSRLMLVVAGTVFGQNPFAIGSHNRMDIGAMIVSDVLHEYRIVGSRSKDADRLVALVFNEFQGSGKQRAAKNQRYEIVEYSVSFHGGKFGFIKVAQRFSLSKSYNTQAKALSYVSSSAGFT